MNNVDEEMIENLMAEEFGNSILRSRCRDSEEVTTSNLSQGEPLNVIPEGIPF